MTTSIPTDPPQFGNPKLHKDGWWHKHPDGSDWVHQSEKPCTDVTVQEWVIAGFSATPAIEPSYLHQTSMIPRAWFDKAGPDVAATMTENVVDQLMSNATQVGTPVMSTLRVGVYDVTGKPDMVDLKAWVQVTER